MVMEDIRVMELLASRICHDLISPIGAINNGIELLEEMGDSVGEEAVKLIGHSAEQASRRLRLFRLCYGAAGADANLSCDDALGSAREYLQGSRVMISWVAADLKGIPNPPKGLAKVVLNLALIAAENMVHGGTVTVSLPQGLAGGQVVISADGRAAGQRLEAEAPLKGQITIEELTAKTVHPYVTGRFAAQYGLSLSWTSKSDDFLELSVSYPVS